MTPSNAVKKLLVDLSSPNCDADMARNLILDFESLTHPPRNTYLGCQRGRSSTNRTF